MFKLLKKIVVFSTVIITTGYALVNISTGDLAPFPWTTDGNPVVDDGPVDTRTQRCLNNCITFLSLDTRLINVEGATYVVNAAVVLRNANNALTVARNNLTAAIATGSEAQISTAATALQLAMTNASNALDDLADTRTQVQTAVRLNLIVASKKYDACNEKCYERPTA